MSERRRHLEQTCAAYRSGTRWEEVVHWIIFWPLVFVWELPCFDQTIFDVEQSVIPVFLTAISRLSKKEYNSAEPGLRQKVTHSSFLIDHTRRVMYCWNHKVSLDRKYWSQSSGRLPQVSGCGFSQRWVLGSSQRWDANSSKNFVPRSSEHFVPGLSKLMQITSSTDPWDLLQVTDQNPGAVYKIKYRFLHTAGWNINNCTGWLHKLQRSLIRLQPVTQTFC